MADISPHNPNRALVFGDLLGKPQWFRYALALWVLPMLVIAIMVVARPHRRTVTHLYHKAAENWSARKSLYQGPSGMNYLPQFAPLFAPFHAIPFPWGDVVWRVAGAAVLAAGLWRILERRFPDTAPQRFFWATALALPLSLPALQNGQANAQLAAVLVMAASCLQRQQWWSAAALLGLGVAIKPIALVMLLLAPMGYPALLSRVPVIFAALAVAPFLLSPSEYVLSQFRDVAANLGACAVISEHRFADLNGILRTLGLELRPPLSTWIRVLGGGIVLVLWWRLAGKSTEPDRALGLLGLSTGYLMLANPMTEANSYVILAPALAIWTLLWLSNDRWSRAGWACAAIVLSMGLLPNLLRPIFGNGFALIWHPTMTAVFLTLLTAYLWPLPQNVPRPAARAESAPHESTIAS